ncbi:MAG: hypothetical protein H6Q00_3432 [Holophagaceae bacterium]|nr:hypothetical protein [Holophagaceae bacterium]
MPLPSRFIARLRRLPLRLRRVLTGGTEGLHPSKFKGSGLTFVENRPYVPGDDPRAINWPLTARVGEPIIKRFEASRELILWLLVDPHPSMFLGDPVSPMRWALEIAGAAMATMNAGKDRFGLLVPGDARTPALRLVPRRGKVAGLKVVEAMAGMGPCLPSPEGWAEALGHWGEQGRGHRLWVLSNGAGLRGLAPLIKPLAARHRVVWFNPETHGRERWPDPAMPPTVERQSWDILEDPVVKLGIWLKGGGA